MQTKPGKFDAIVVGAGPAGSSTALTLAQQGLSVALIERGQYPGSKNVFGGTIYSEPTEVIIPGFWEEAPLERKVVSDLMWLMDEDSAVVAGFTGMRYGKPPYNKVTVLRGKFDNWLATKAVQAGAKLYNKTLVQELVYDGDSVVGVQFDTGEQLHGDVVVLAEGVNAFLTKKAGLRSDIPPHTVTLYVKEVLALPAERIEERFHLNKDEGAVIGMLGWPTAGSIGKAGIWTNKETVSIIVGTFLSEMVKKGLSPFHLLHRVKQHPMVKKILEGAEPIEYQAHLIPKGGYKVIPKLYDNGILVVGDAAVMISGRRGTDLAMLSGKYAGEAIAQAKSKGDFSGKQLSAYQVKLNNTFFMKDIKAGKGKLKYIEHHTDADYLLAKSANEASYLFFSENMDTNQEKMGKIMETLRGQQQLSKSAKDLIAGVQHWGFF